MPRAAEISLDPRVLLFSALVAVLTGILFGLAPAWHASRLDLQGTLKEAGRGATSSRAGLRQGLVDCRSRPDVSFSWLVPDCCS